eukprot:m51a1_g9486 hypothetical protein (352) ;mRNA; f:630948-632134
MYTHSAVILLALIALSAVADKPDGRGRGSSSEPGEDGRKGSEGDAGRHPEGDRWHRERKSVLRWDAESVTFRSSDPTSGDRVDLDLRSEGNSPMRFRLRYYPTDKSAVALDSRVVFKSIVEFEESSSTFDGWDANDVELRRVSIGRTGWAPITAPTVQAIGGVNVTMFTITYNGVGAVMVLRLMLADSPYSAGGSSYSPSQAKIDVELRNWTYSGNSSYLALACAVQSPEAFVHETTSNSEDPEHVRIFDNDVSMAFGWNRTVEADGKAAYVVASRFEATTPDSESDDAEESTGKGGAREHVQYAKMTHFAFNAVQPKVIVWDPYLGVQNQAAAHSLSALMAAAALLASLF